jgi:sialate O-acetylesterase
MDLKHIYQWRHRLEALFPRAKESSRPRFHGGSWLLALIVSWGLGFGFSAHADVKLPALFSENMVLQRGIYLPVWGWADEGESVTVEFRGQKDTAKTSGGKWSVTLPAQRAGGPDTLTVSGKNKIEVKNVLVGEVWICSGQSNMEWPMRLTFEPEQSISGSANPMLRLFTVPKLKANEPVPDVKGSWGEASPKTTTNFSAVAYYFGRDLQKALGVPVGLIHTSWGGSPAEVWMKQEVLAGNPEYKTALLDGHAAAMKRYEEAQAAFEAEQAELKKQGKTSEKRPPQKPSWKPAELYNGMIAPLIPYAIKGAIWYQGESNAGRAQQYRTLYADMIRNWRRDWNQGDFTFLAVQLAPYTKIKDQPGDSDWAELREAQLLATKVLPKVGMAVITDVGEENDIHPRKKQPVGARLALAARGIAYGEKITFSGPLYKEMQVKGDKVALTFDHVGAGLEARDGDLKGFSIAGADRKFVWASAKIEGDKVIVSSPEVSAPVAVRYGWANYPVVNLWNKDGLPASPFRTDDFPMITNGKK